MEDKKKNFLDNFRLKTKLVNLKKPGKKAFGKRGKKLAHRRSISVPDLRFVPAEAFSTDSATPSDAISFSNSRGESDTDSVASGSVVDGLLFTDKLNDSIPESRLKVPIDRTAAALNRISSPAGTPSLHEEIENMINPGSQKRMNLTQEGFYAQADKRAMGNARIFTFDPIPKPRSVFTNALPPRPDIVGRENLSGEDTPAAIVPSGAVAAVLARASSMGEQVKPYTEKRTTAFEYRESSSEKGTPPATRANAQGTPLESADGTSSPPSCGSPSEERVNMPWTTDSEDLDRELCSYVLTEEALLEEAQPEEELEETTEVSFITSVFYYNV